MSRRLARNTGDGAGRRASPRTGGGRTRALQAGGLLAGLLVLGAAWASLPATALAASPTGGGAGTITVNAWQAALIALGYYLANSPWLFGLAYYSLFRPLVAGLLVGIILGDPAQGTLIGAAINLPYLGFISAGASLPSDPALAGWVGTSVALAGHLSPAQAIALAVAIGLLGTLIFNVRMTGDSIFAHWADARAERGDIDGVALMNWLPPQLLLFVISFVPVFVMALSGADVVTGLLDRLPAWVLNGMAIAGGVLPAIGIALNMRFIFRGQVIPYFFLGYLLMVATNNVATQQETPIVLVAGLGLVLAFLHLTFVTEGALTRLDGRAARSPALEAPAVAGGEAREPPARSAPAGAAPATAPSGAIGASGEGRPTATLGDAGSVHLRRSDVLRSWILWTFFSHANYNYERLQGTGFAHAMTPIIRRLYTSEEEIKAALLRHLVFFNTEPNLGNVIHGTVIAMEEQRANGAAIDDDAINSVKSGLMGPLAGIGDTISQGTLTPIFLAMGIGIAGVSSTAGTSVAGSTGNPLGPLVYLALISVSIVAIGYVAWMQGYSRGRAFVTDLLRSGAIDRLLTGAGVLGNVVLGALAAKVIVVFLAPTLVVNGTRLNLQLDVLDKLMPGLLPLGLVLLTWWLLRRFSPLTLLAIYLAISIAGAIPIFGAGPTNANDFSYGACTSSVLHPYTPCSPPSAAPSSGAGAAAPAASPSPSPAASPSASAS